MVRGFDVSEVERARRYHRPLYLVLLAELGLSLAVLAWLTFDARFLREWFAGPWALETLALVAAATLALTLARLPLGLYRYRHEREWGFSTQGLGGWAADRAKGLAVGFVLSAVPLLALVALQRWLPSTWPLVAAPGAAALVVLLSFLTPVVLEPVFNRFRPLADAELAAELRALADRAGVPVRDVLVADASRRTRKHNAYVSGLGSTRRVVLFDTMLEGAGRPELRLVVAHELGHRRAAHVLKGTLLGAAVAAASVVALWVLLEWDALLDAAGASGPGDPAIVPLVLLSATVLELALAPLGATLSRRWEREADRFSIELTNDVDAYRRAHHDLAVANLADLDPPRALYLAFFSHPTPPERLAAAS
jgi:STE24 endopeptidase